ncbi:MAG: aldehyde dehydrogenase family protein [Candidatus Bathyarchaeia archaeon]|jgi:acyl-CoA reductase-like NAD-dependent aldehyde dehydrogenase
MQAETSKFFVNGKWTAGSSTETFELINPATGDVIRRVPRATKDDVREAVEVGRRAFEATSWRDMEQTKRGKLLMQIAALMRQNFDELAKLETLNQGKPIRESKGDVAWTIRAFEYWAGAADKIEGETIPVTPNRLTYTLREPIGVTAHIIPWNYPLALAARSIAPALAAGNTIVAKPAELTPLTLLKIAEYAQKSGCPNGVLNVITGSGSVAGRELVSNLGIDGITFTGSTETGQQIMETAAKNVTPVLLELGGKNPNIVFPDADFQKAVQMAKYAIFTNAGQMCWAGSRLFLHNEIYEKFLTELKNQTELIKIGLGQDEKTELGPLVSKDQQERVLNYIKSGSEDGARLVTGGTVPEEQTLRKGYFLKPTIFTDVTTTMKIGCEEIFGPVLTVFKFKSVEEVVQMANDTKFGLYAGVWTNDLKVSQRLVNQLQAGVVAVNDYLVAYPQTPFGGYKDSGIGYESGLQAISHYTRIKSVTVNAS